MVERVGAERAAASSGTWGMRNSVASITLQAPTDERAAPRPRAVPRRREVQARAAFEIGYHRHAPWRKRQADRQPMHQVGENAQRVGGTPQRSARAGSGPRHRAKRDRPRRRPGSTNRRCFPVCDSDWMIRWGTVGGLSGIAWLGSSADRASCVGHIQRCRETPGFWLNHAPFSRSSRRGWDSNPRMTLTAIAGFQDRCVQPLRHPARPLDPSILYRRPRRAFAR